MNKTDKYIIMGTLLFSGAICLYFGQDMYAGMFWGIFFAFIKDVLNVSTEEIKEVQELYKSPHAKSTLSNNEVDNLIKELGN